MKLRSTSPVYRVLKGINYGADRHRLEPGTLVSEIPETTLNDLLLVEAIALHEPTPNDSPAHRYGIKDITTNGNRTN